MRGPFLAVAMVATMLTSGCHAPTDGQATDGTVRLSGWFSDHNETIQQDFDATVGPYSRDVIFLESFPPGFQIRGLDPAACPELRDTLRGKDYIASVGACAEDRDADADGDQPTSGP